MRHQLSFPEIGARELEDGAKHTLGVRLAVVIGEVSVVVDVRDEQRNRPLDGARLGNGDRGGVDEGVVCGKTPLLIEKDGMLLRAGAGRDGGCDNRKSERLNGARERERPSGRRESRYAEAKWR